MTGSKVWMEAIGTRGSSDAQGSASAQDRYSYGALTGVDIPFVDEEGYFGFFAGYERGKIETDSVRAKSDLDNYHFGAFATHPVEDGFTISGSLGASWHNVETSRVVAFPGFSETPKGDTEAYTLNAFAQVSKPLQSKDFAVEPFVGAALAYSHVDGYTETDGGSANLVVDSVSTTVPSTIVGTRIGKAVETGNGKIVNFNAALGWQHNFGDLENRSRMQFAGGTTSFDSFGPPRSRDSAVIGFGAEIAAGAGADAYVGYNGTISGQSDDHGFKAGIKWKF